MAGIELANWNWKVVHRFVSERFGVSLHRLGFAFKRPKKRLLKANEAKREAFAAEYAALWDEAGRTGGSPRDWLGFLGHWSYGLLHSVRFPQLLSGAQFV